MNRPIRRLSAALAVLLAALFVNLNFVQVVGANGYRDNPKNQRVILAEYASPRGQILIDGGTVIAMSKKTSDQLKYLRVYPDGTNPALPLAPVYAPVSGYYALNLPTSPYYLGTSGVELAENGILAGTDPRLFVSQLTGLLTGRNANGGSVELTINQAAQEAAYQAMKVSNGLMHVGAVVALDPTTGAILAAVSTPSYDPNTLSSHNSTASQRAYDAYCEPNGGNGDCTNPVNPLQNRAFNQSYPPGSVFKVITAAAALKAGVKPNDSVNTPNGYWPNGNGSGSCQGQGQSSSCVENFNGENCYNGTSKAPLIYAFAKSCNTAFASLAVEKIGGQKLADEAKLFGLDGPSLTVPLPVWPSTVGSSADLADKALLSHISFGQQNVRITPLQGAMIAAAVANNGALMRPYLVNKELAPNLSVLSHTSPTSMSQVLGSAENDQLAAMMQAVVTSPEGTASGFAPIPGYVVGGKTGTADTGEYSKVQNNSDPKTQPDAWFVGYAVPENRSTNPAQPSIAVAVLMEHAGVMGNEVTGGEAAAPVARAVMAAYLNSSGGH